MTRKGYLNQVSLSSSFIEDGQKEDEDGQGKGRGETNSATRDHSDSLCVSLCVASVYEIAVYFSLFRPVPL